MLPISRYALSVVLLSTLLACGGGGGGGGSSPATPPPVTPPPPQAPPIIASFTATPAIVNAGQAFTLSWSVTGASAVSIDQGVGDVTGASSKSVSAAAGITYTLSATNAQGSKSATTSVVVAPPVTTGSFPILYVTQTPVSGFASRTTTFGNHLASAQAVPRGGDLMIRYPDGSERNLTREAGFGTTGFQGNAAIAVREPAVHWNAGKALFSMVVGSPASQYEVRQFQWQIYEVSGLEKGATARIVKIAQQPAYNNVSPFYGSDDRILFTSDRPRSGAAHLYPQLDEYESFPIVTGIWSLDPASGKLRLLNHTVSGAFSPSVDSFGRVVFTRWDHLQQDQQADADRASPGSPPNGAFLYADESAGAARLALANEVFPEPRSETHAENVANGVNGHTFNHFMPWQLNEDGTSEETLNHVGRHEFGASYMPRTFKADASLLDFSRPALFLNRVLLHPDGGLFHLREDPLHPGLYYGSNVREFGTAGANQIVRFTGSPSTHPEQMVMTAVTHPETANYTVDGATPNANHSGMYRNPLPLSDGALVAVHTAETRLDKNDGTRAAPHYRYQFRLTALKASGANFTADRVITAGSRKALWYWDPDTRVDFDGLLWELDPVEVAPRARPARRADALEAPERAVLLEESVDEAQLRAWLASNDLALIVTRDNTSRDQGERQQPFNLRVPGGVSKTGDGGKVYDVSHLQLFQADQIRGYGGGAAPRAGRRPLAQAMHDPKVKNPANPGAPAGSVKLGLDGSSAAFVPAGRAMSWQLTDGAGKAVVRERNWISFQPGEIRTCVSCHGLNSKDQAGGFAPLNKPEALRTLMRYWKTLPKS